MTSKLKASEALNFIPQCYSLSQKEKAAFHEQILITEVKLRQVPLKNLHSTIGKLSNTFSFDTVYDATSKHTDLSVETMRSLATSGATSGLQWHDVCLLSNENW